MKTDTAARRRGWLAAVILTVAGLGVAWLCLRVAVGQLLAPTAPVALAIAPSNAEAVLDRALADVARPDAPVSDAAVTAARRVAAEQPLDARPYLLLSLRAAAGGDDARSLALLEAGERLDPRQRLIHILLLERYLRDDNYLNSAQQFSVLSRLVGAANSPIAQALMLMASDDKMRPAVRRTLDQDANLERSVLVMLARSDADPARIFDLASPRAIAGAGAKDGWGAALVERLVKTGAFTQARSIWRRIYSVPEAAAAEPIFNPAFADLAASPPFNWNFEAGSLGVADPDKEALVVDYYGRSSGDLASQTLLLKPGRYRLGFAAEGAEDQTASTLSWQILCLPAQGKPVLDVPVRPSPAGRPQMAEFVVPSGCTAQRLRLYGQAGEFPEEVNTTIRKLAIEPSSGSRTKATGS